MKKIAFILFSYLIIQSCDCIQNVYGTVVDKDTGEPLSNVAVQKIGNDNDNSITNENGEFAISSISGGIFRCPPMKIIIKKEGYEMIENKGGGIIKLKKIK